jgi:hypothetical protein
MVYCDIMKIEAYRSVIYEVVCEMSVGASYCKYMHGNNRRLGLSVTTKLLTERQDRGI